MEKRTQRKKNQYMIHDNYAEIFVGKQNQIITKVDLCNLDMLLNTCSWTYNKLNGYVQGRRVGKTFYIHKLVCPSKQGFYTDHISGDKLNNMIENLRVVTPQQSQFNTRRKGCSFRPERNKWQAYIRLNKKFKHLGYFDTENEAIKARKEAEQSYRFGFNRGDI